MQGLSGITTDTERHFILDAGVVYANIDIERLETNGFADAVANAEQLGATRGGNVFTPNRNIRDIEVDGALGPVRELQRFASVRPSLTVNLLEITPDNLKASLAGAIMTDVGNFKRITGGEITDNSYWRNIAIAATLTDTSDPVVIVVRNPLVLESPSFELTSMAELVLSVTFVGTAFQLEGTERRWDSDLVKFDNSGTEGMFDSDDAAFKWDSGVKKFDLSSGVTLDESDLFSYATEPWAVYYPSV